MNRKQKNHLTMSQAVESFLKEKEPKYSDVEELKDQRAALKLKNEEIGKKDDERENVTKGSVPEKQSARDSAVESAVAVAGRLFAFAKKNNDLSLMEKTNITRTKLYSLRYVDFPIVINSIKELAENNLASLGRFGITAEKVAELGARLKNFTAASENKDTTVAVKSGTYVTLTQLFRESDDILDSIDKLMEEYNETDLEFYSGYKAARVIKDVGTRYAKEEEPLKKGVSEDKKS